MVSVLMISEVIASLFFTTLTSKDMCTANKNILDSDGKFMQWDVLNPEIIK